MAAASNRDFLGGLIANGPLRLMSFLATLHFTDDWPGDLKLSSLSRRHLSRSPFT